jgi:hypothetical protein
LWSDHFGSVLHLVLGVLGDNDAMVRDLSLRVVRMMLKHQTMMIEASIESVVARLLERHSEADRYGYSACLPQPLTLPPNSSRGYGGSSVSNRMQLPLLLGTHHVAATPAVGNSPCCSYPCCWELTMLLWLNPCYVWCHQCGDRVHG